MNYYDITQVLKARGDEGVLMNDNVRMNGCRFPLIAKGGKVIKAYETEKEAAEDLGITMQDVIALNDPKTSDKLKDYSGTKGQS